jgi:hypothetical protein
MDRSPAFKSFLDYALNGTVILSLGAGLLFLMGVIYFSFYYGSFGIDPTILDFPAFLYLSTGALQPSWLVLLVFILLFRSVRISILTESESTRVHGLERFGADPSILLALYFCAFLALVYCILVMPMKQGKKDAERAYQNGGEIRLTFTPAALAGEEPELVLANEAGRLRFLAQSKDLVVVFEAPQSQDGPGDRKKSVFVVSRTDLLGVHYWYSPSQH